MICSQRENGRPPREHPNNDCEHPSPGSLLQILNHTKPQKITKPTCGSVAVELGAGSSSALKRFFFPPECKRRKVAAAAKGRADLYTVENRRMNNCAAAAVQSWPTAACKGSPPREFWVLRYFTFMLFFVCFLQSFEVICSHQFHFAHLFSAHRGTNIFQQFFFCCLLLIKADVLCFYDARQ